MICINTPANPTGAALLADLDALADLLEGTSIVVMSDEVYEHLIYDGRTHTSTGPCALARTIAGDLFFREDLPQYRLENGLCGGAAAIDGRIQESASILCVQCASPDTADCRVFGVSGRVSVAAAVFIRKKRNILLQAMSNTRLKPLRCAGTYFQLFDYGHLSKEDDLSFCKRLTKDYGVAAIPVFSAFHSNGHDDRVIRLCFAKTEDMLSEAAERLARL